MADRNRDSRVIRQRQRDLAIRLDQLSRAPAASGPMLVKVISLTAVPTATGKYFACTPVTPGGAECEGCTPTFTVETGTVFVLVIGSKVPVLGDYLIARPVGGRWVADAGTGKPKCTGRGNTLCFSITGCNSCAVAGATITFKLSGSTVASGTTNSLGSFCLTDPDPGTYTIEWSIPGTIYAGTATATITNSCNSGGSSVIIGATTGYWCSSNCGRPIPVPLYITDDAGTRQISYSDGITSGGTAECVIYGGYFIRTSIGSGSGLGSSCSTPVWQILTIYEPVTDVFPQTCAQFALSQTCPPFAGPGSASIIQSISTDPCVFPFLIGGTYDANGCGYWYNTCPLAGSAWTIHN